MGFLDALLGNASEVDKSEVAEELAPILADNEHIDRVYKLIRDMYVFTNKRLLLIDKQGVTGRKVEYHSIPYRAITQFKVETAGHFDMDAELRIWISGSAEPIKKELKKNTAVGIQRSLANWMFG
ncbi:PH domain-containing protein [Bowmanella yangjiangensis]|uniref:PH domain-containing protein n=1 Tax=Bowmanella yangjiangensis TaxID=2811230 RepID=A0ABS3CQZ0_9ALTE|nr:PH domain-containing protein [Bowmanella yangjiangensis]MBN7819528.1 PH domain-containing protein [Bowmanella yangjiangensis]